MGTLAIQASGFSTLPASAPANWPATVTWPGGGSPNGTKTYTISDADWIRIMTWTAATQPGLGTTPSAGSILLAWVAIWANGTIQGVVNYFTTPPAPGIPPIIQ